MPSRKRPSPRSVGWRADSSQLTSIHRCAILAAGEDPSASRKERSAPHLIHPGDRPEQHRLEPRIWGSTSRRSPTAIRRSA
jgi:hypothetical protein